MRNGLKIYHFFLIIALIAFVAIGSVLFLYYRNGSKEQQIFDDLSARMTNEGRADEKEQVPSDRYLTAYAENSDYVGWLVVSGTAIDYPVMYTPNDPQFYLHRSFDKSESKSGTPFVGENCNVDSSSVIIYGHNMKNDTMFSTLDRFKEESFRKENPYFSLETKNGTEVYEIFAAAETKIKEMKEGESAYYEMVGNLPSQEFEDLKNWLLENSMYDTGIQPVYGEKIVMLSTCSYHTSDGRFLIAGRKIQ